MTTLLLILCALAALAVAFPSMSDQAAKAVRKTAPRSGTRAVPIANGVTLYEGQFVQYEGGYANHWDETGQFAGICVGGKDRLRDGVLLGNTSDTPPPEAIIDESGTVLMHMSIGGTPTQAKVGLLVYCADSNPANMTMTDTTNFPIGRLVRYRSATDVDVELFTPTEHLAGVAGATWDS